MMADVNYDKATASAPWFSVGPDAQGSGQSLTSQRTALNEQTSGVAADLSSQNGDVATGLDSIITAINAKPSA